MPANLQGVWNNSTTPPWSSDYHTNINLQMNYWPADVTNLSETVPPLTEFIDSMRPHGRKTAGIHYGAAAWFSYPGDGQEVEEPEQSDVPSTVKIDGEHPDIVYVGDWILYPKVGTYDDTQKYNNNIQEGDYVELTFEGTGVDWIGHFNPTDGIADVYINGEYEATIDTYGDPQQRQNVNYSIRDLPFGTHTIRIEPTGEQNENCS